MIASQIAGQEEPQPDLSGRRVLIVEDEYFLADDMRLGLEAAGAEVVGPLANVRAGLAAAGQAGLDCAVLDLNLREEDGMPIADALRGRGIPIVFVTGYGEGRIPSHLRDVPRFEKPVAVERVVARVGELCRAGTPTDMPQRDPRS